MVSTDYATDYKKAIWEKCVVEIVSKDVIAMHVKPRASYGNYVRRVGRYKGCLSTADGEIGNFLPGRYPQSALHVVTRAENFGFLQLGDVDNYAFWLYDILAN